MSAAGRAAVCGRAFGTEEGVAPAPAPAPAPAELRMAAAWMAVPVQTAWPDDAHSRAERSGRGAAWAPTGFFK